jgi:hypothetical protein
MKSIKRLGLFVLATSAVLAFASASTALAESTSLCDFDPGTGPAETCPEGTHRVTHIHEANLSGSKAKMVSSTGTVECDILFLGDASSPLATPLFINGFFTYSNCTQGCTVGEAQFTEKEKEEIEEEIEEEVPLGSTIAILKKGHEKGEVTILSYIQINCGTPCTYYSVVGTTEGTAAGPLLSLETNGEISDQAQELAWLRGFFCPKKALLYLRITPLTALSIAR